MPNSTVEQIFGQQLRTVVLTGRGLPTGCLPVRLPIVICITVPCSASQLQRATNMTETVKVRFEPKMMIDGKLVDGQAGTFTNLNPATEEPLGEVADASKEDMHRAIDAARRAFDETDWSTNHKLRQRCLLQLHEAIDAEREELREELILEVGAPRAITYGPQLDAPLEDGLKYPARLIDEYPWETDLGDKVISLTGTLTTRKVWRGRGGGGARR